MPISTAGACTPTVADNTCSGTNLVNPTCDPFGTIQDVWYTFTATAADLDLIVTSTTVGTGDATDVSAALYDACGGTELQTACGILDGGTVALTGLTPSTVYQLQLWNGGGTEEGTFNVCLEEPACLPATVTFTEMLDCASGNYTVMVDVTDFGSATDFTVTGGVALTTIDGTTIFPAAAGPFTIGTPATVVLVPNDDTVDAICTVTSPIFDPICPPANDECVDAEPLTVNGTCTTTAWNSGAATDSGTTACAGTAEDDVWFSFVADGTDAFVEVSTASASYDAVIEIYEADCATPLVGGPCTDATATGGTELADLTGLLVDGQTYLIQVYDWTNGADADPTFDICVYSPTCSVATATFTEMLDCASGTYTVMVDVTDFGTATDFTVTGGGALTTIDGTTIFPVAAGPFTIGTPATITLAPNDDDVDASCSVVSAEINPICPPANDECVDAEPLTLNGTCITTAWNSGGATDSGTTACAGTAEDDVWFSFVADGTDAFVEVSTASTSYDAVIEIYEADCSTPLVGGPCADATAGGGTELADLTGLLVDGQTYLIQVYDWTDGADADPTFDICVYAPTCSVATATFTEMLDCASGTYTVMVDVTDFGTATDFTVTGGGGLTTIDGATLLPAVAGPFTIGTPATITLVPNDDDVDATCSVVSAEINPVCPPDNDDCANAEALTLATDGTCTTTAWDSSGATDSGTTACAGTAEDDVWFSFVADGTDAFVEVSTASTSYDAVIEIYEADCSTPLVGGPCADATAGGGTELADLTGLLVDGQTYLIQVYDWTDGADADPTFDICVYTTLDVDCEGVAGGPDVPGEPCDDGDATTGNDVYQADCSCAGELIDCEGVAGGTDLPGEPCDDGDATTSGDVYGTDCVCAGLTVDCEGVAGGTDLPGEPCDDGDATTGNDVYQADCSCAGELIDCEGVAGGTDLPGEPCDDGDATTINDVYGTDCTCAGTLLPEDCEGVAGGTDLPGEPCDDGDATTGNDVYQADCTCAGDLIDCEGVAGGTDLPGEPCDDGNATTINDVYGTDCVCAGTLLPEDCEGTPGGTAVAGTPCDDGDATTGDDTYQADCSCVGQIIDCLGVAGGSDLPGADCDDGDATTEGDVYGTDCVCAGTLLPEDCEGTPGGTAVAGTPCDDGDAGTGNDTYQADCSCVGEVIDCEGTIGGTILPGTPCDDGDATTGNDLYQADCSCAGTPLTPDCLGVPGGPAVPGSACDDGDAATQNDAYDADCICIGVIECPYLIVEVSPYQGVEGGITPFYYNTVEITVSGGTAPYSLVGNNNEGYVRYAVIANNANEMIVRVIYGDNAEYEFIFSDALGCETISTNDPVADGAVAQELDIYDYAISADDQITLTSYEGAIDVFVEGGTAPYTFDWAGPVSFTAIAGAAATGVAPATPSYSLPALRSGWYTTTVTDAAGATSQGWYWVPSIYTNGAGTDRGKVGETAIIAAQPNPFSNETTILFGIGETSHTNVAVYSIDGKKVVDLYNGIAEAGQVQQVSLNASSLAAGMYIVTLKSDSGETQHHKVMLNK